MNVSGFFWNRGRSLLLWSLFCRFFLVLSVFFLILVVVEEIRRWNNRQADFFADFSRIKILKEPDWIPRGVQSEILGGFPSSGGVNVSREEAFTSVKERFVQNPWVEDILSIECRFPNSLFIRAKLRKPFCLAKQEGRIFLMDGKGVRLPGEYSQSPHEFKDFLLILTGISSEPPEPGKPWNDPAILDGISVVKELFSSLKKREIEESGIVSIDLSNLRGCIDPRLSEIVLLSKGRTKIGWGRSARSRRFGELSVEEKVRNLREVLYRIPGLEGLALVEVRFPNPIIVPWRSLPERVL